MLLTDKALRDCNKWLTEYYFRNREDYHKFSNEIILRKHYRKTEVEKNALIIEWLDSVNIKISITYSKTLKGFGFLLYSEYCKVNSGAHTRQEATQQAILKANEIYNNLKTK